MSQSCLTVKMSDNDNSETKIYKLFVELVQRCLHAEHLNIVGFTITRMHMTICYQPNGYWLSTANIAKVQIFLVMAETVSNDWL